MNSYNRENQYLLIETGFMRKVYLWMAVGLGITAIVSYFCLPIIKMNNIIFFGAIILQLGVYFYYTFKWESLSFSTSATLYILYSALNGIIFIPIFYVYTMSSIAYVFFIAAGMFLAMAIYGWFTKSDLASMSSFLFMGLIGLIIANIVNIFIKSETFSLIYSVFGVAIFSLFVAYNVAMLKNLSKKIITTEDNANKIALIGAFQIYITFINLFLYLLRLFGRRRD